MSWSDALSMISQALVKALQWFDELMPSQYVTALITVFGIYTVARLLLMPLIGKAGSDAARRTLRGE